MKPLRRVTLFSALILLFWTGAALGQTSKNEMIIFFKDGRVQVIELSSVSRIEFRQPPEVPGSPGMPSIPPGVTPGQDLQSLVIGEWTYISGNFKDTHQFNRGGTLEGGGRWKIEDNKLIVQWHNRWVNVYDFPPVDGRMNGFNVDPSGRKSPITAVRKSK